jgi:hypothetical protein
MSLPLSPARVVTIETFSQAQSTSSLRGFAKVVLPSGMTLTDVAIHVGDERAWASPPSRPMLNRDGIALRDAATGKIRYSPIISFSSKELRYRFSDAIIEAMRLARPDVLAPSE